MNKEQAIKTYCYKSFFNRKEYFKIHEKGLLYKPDNKEPLFVYWENFGKIVDCFGQKVAVYDVNERKLLHIKYDMENFIELIDEICKRLVINPNSVLEIRKLEIKSSYSFVICCSLLLFMEAVIIFSSSSREETFISLFGFIFFFALFLFSLTRPKEVILSDSNLVIKNHLKTEVVLYKDISKVYLEKLSKSKGPGYVLVLIIKLNNGKSFTFNFSPELIDMFVTMKKLMNKSFYKDII